MPLAKASSTSSPSLNKKSKATVIKSPNDTQNYRVIVLKNGLRAVLISDLEHDDDATATAADKTRAVRGGAAKSRINTKRNTKMNHSENRKHTLNLRLDDLSIEPDDDASWETASDSSSGGSESGHEEDYLQYKSRPASPEDSFEGSEKVACAAAALCLGVGSFADPDDLPGLAHFVEHMLFMGSENYPDENAFDKFLNKHDGSSNAETGCESTVFYFDVAQRQLVQALDIFAQFFISPLMKKDCIDRELKAIENEFHETKNSDNRRKDHLLRSIATPGHPMGKFTCGNEYTLKTLAEERGIDIYQKCREFYCRYYSAHYMTLAVHAKAKLDDIEKLVKRIFTAIPNNGLPQPTFYHLADAYDTTEFQRLYKVVPVKDNNKMKITWSLPYMPAYYRDKALCYISYLGAHEGAGSILSYLKQKLWAQDLSCTYEMRSTGYLFFLQVTLTDKGLSHVYEIMTVVFEYFEMLRNVGPQASIYKELSNIRKNLFDWQGKVCPIDAVQQLAEDMHLYPPEDYLTGGTLIFEYKPKNINHYLQLLTPGRCNVMVQSKSFDKREVYDIREELYYRTRYSVTDMENCWLSKWKQLNPRPELHLPSCNPFIVTNFIVNRASSKEYRRPQVIRENQRIKIWYHQDLKFFEPRGYICLYLMSTVVSATAQSQAMLDLFVELLTVNLQELTFLANTAELNSNYYLNQTGINVILSGFSEKLPQFFQTLIDRLLEFTVDDDWFHVIKERQMKKYYNSLINREELSKDLLNHLTVSDMWSLPEKRAALRTLQKNELLAFVAEFFETLLIEGYVYGNFLIKEANEIADYLDRKFDQSALSSTEKPEARFNQLPKGTRYCRVSNFNASDTNSYVLNFYEVGPGVIHDVVLTELLVRVMSEQCFDVLRTKEQLGYNIFCCVATSCGILGIVIAVNFQSTRYSARYVDERIEDFLAKFESKLGAWKNKDFRPNLDSFIASKQLTEGDMDFEAHRNWMEIVDQTYLFDRPYCEAKEVKKLTLSELQLWFNKCFSNTHKRKLSIQVVGSGEATRSQRVPKFRSPDEEHASDSRWSEAGPRTSTAFQPRELLLSASPSSDWTKNCEYEYLQDEQSERRKDPCSIDDPVAFKNSLPLYPVCKFLKEFPSAANGTRK